MINLSVLLIESTNSLMLFLMDLADPRLQDLHLPLQLDLPTLLHLPAAHHHFGRRRFELPQMGGGSLGPHWRIIHEVYANELAGFAVGRHDVAAVEEGRFAAGDRLVHHRNG